MVHNTKLFLAALVGGATARPLNATYFSVLSTAMADQYTPYSGDGSASNGWPAQSAWAPYDALWAANLPLVTQSCGWHNWGTNNSPAETAALDRAIRGEAAQSGVDARFILAIVMQESGGCVRAPTTNNGVVNPGLMQSHNGLASCAGRTPCPDADIGAMVADGTRGTPSGDGLQQTLARARGAIGGSPDDARNFYTAARMYNSGSVDYGNLNNGLGSTPCYASDVANRLTGWTLANKACRG